MPVVFEETVICFIARIIYLTVLIVFYIVQVEYDKNVATMEKGLEALNRVDKDKPYKKKFDF